MSLGQHPPSHHQPTPVGVFSPLLAGSTDSGLFPFLLSVFMYPVIEWVGTGSVADPGWLSRIRLFRIPGPDSGVKKSTGSAALVTDIDI
jgi:hypothetical protein